MNLMTVCTSFPFGLGRVDSLGILSKKKKPVYPLFIMTLDMVMSNVRSRLLVFSDFAELMD